MNYRLVIGATLVTLPLFAGCMQNAKSSSGSVSVSAGGSVSVSAAAPAPQEVTLTPMRFAAIQELLASKKGKIVVMDVWSTYCEPCMKEFPGLVALDKKFGREKVACVSLCANFSGLGKPTDPDVFDEPLKFLKAQGATFDNVLSADPDTKLYEDLKIASVPAIFVYDRDGKVLKVFENEAKYSEIEAFVATLVK
jgi:thiol-disulfide isomerase/thioredoxin